MRQKASTSGARHHAVGLRHLGGERDHGDGEGGLAAHLAVGEAGEHRAQAGDGGADLAGAAGDERRQCAKRCSSPLAGQLAVAHPVTASARAWKVRERAAPWQHERQTRRLPRIYPAGPSCRRRASRSGVAAVPCCSIDHPFDPMILHVIPAICGSRRCEPAATLRPERAPCARRIGDAGRAASLPAGRGAMDGFVATFANRLDQKGRVSVPAPFRAVLAREGEDGLYCYPALDRPAIDGGGARLQAGDRRAPRRLRRPSRRTTRASRPPSTARAAS